eukprot:Sspe_Gene.30624::Locus_15137_Transcript_1_1_Confidence_1.000_Length_3242::g.30624::m.30624
MPRPRREEIHSDSSEGLRWVDDENFTQPLSSPDVGSPVELPISRKLSEMRRMAETVFRLSANERRAIVSWWQLELEGTASKMEKQEATEAVQNSEQMRIDAENRLRELLAVDLSEGVETNHKTEELEAQLDALERSAVTLEKEYLRKVKGLEDDLAEQQEVAEAAARRVVEMEQELMTLRRKQERGTAEAAEQSQSTSRREAAVARAEARAAAAEAKVEALQARVQSLSNGIKARSQSPGNRRNSKGPADKAKGEGPSLKAPLPEGYRRMRSVRNVQKAERAQRAEDDALEGRVGQLERELTESRQALTEMRAMKDRLALAHAERDRYKRSAATFRKERDALAAQLSHRMDRLEGEAEALRSLATSRSPSGRPRSSSRGRGSVSDTHVVPSRSPPLSAGDGGETKTIPRLGLEVTDSVFISKLGGEMKYDGVRVVSARRPAAPAVHDGDMITRIDGRHVSSLEEFRHMVTDLIPGVTVQLTVRRRHPSGSTYLKTVDVIPWEGIKQPGVPVGKHRVRMGGTGVTDAATGATSPTGDQGFRLRRVPSDGDFIEAWGSPW